MLAGDPGKRWSCSDWRKNMKRAGDEVKLIELLERYLAAADDEGNAYECWREPSSERNKPERPRQL